MGDALRAIGAPFRIFEILAPQNHRYRFQLLLVGYPALFWASLKAAARSLLRKREERPDAVVLGSDMEVLVFSLLKLLPFAARPKVFFLPFIYTERSSSAANRLRLLYYRFIMRRTDCAVCHSSLEVERYRQLFHGCGTEFVFVPWGGYVPPLTEISARSGGQRVPKDLPVIVAAGRSGRDYPTLVKAVAGLPCRLTIICNERSALGGISESEQVEILPNCFGVAYLWRIAQADIVAVPLRVADISAGQMVLIQAMALARPLIVTRTPTVGDYLEDGRSALLVPRGDAAAMAAAIGRLLADPAGAQALGEQARADYETRFNGEAHLRSLVRLIEDRCGLRPAEPKRLVEATS